MHFKWLRLQYKNSKLQFGTEEKVVHSRSTNIDTNMGYIMIWTPTCKIFSVYMQAQVTLGYFFFFGLRLLLDMHQIRYGSSFEVSLYQCFIGYSSEPILKLFSDDNCGKNNPGFLV